MSIKISSIKYRGDTLRERVVMKVIGEDDVGAYALLRSRYRNGSVTTGVTNTLWFPDQKVGHGDLVVVYTKKGTSSVKTNEDETKTHFFYWNQPGALWETSEYAPVLLQVARWHSYKLEDL